MLIVIATGRQLRASALDKRRIASPPLWICDLSQQFARSPSQHVAAHRRLALPWLVTTTRCDETRPAVNHCDGRHHPHLVDGAVVIPLRRESAGRSPLRHHVPSNRPAHDRIRRWSTATSLPETLGSLGVSQGCQLPRSPKAPRSYLESTRSRSITKRRTVHTVAFRASSASNTWPSSKPTRRIRPKPCRVAVAFRRRCLASVPGQAPDRRRPIRLVNGQVAACEVVGGLLSNSSPR